MWCFTDAYVVYASLCLSSWSLSGTRLLVWIQFHWNTDLTMIYTHFSGRGQSKAPSILPKPANTKNSPMLGDKTEHLHLTLSLCVNEAKCLKIMLMTSEWAEIILPIIPLHFPMILDSSNCLQKPRFSSDPCTYPDTRKTYVLTDNGSIVWILSVSYQCDINTAN